MASDAYEDTVDITNNRLLLLSVIIFEALVMCFGLLFYAGRLQGLKEMAAFQIVLKRRPPVLPIVSVERFKHPSVRDGYHLLII